MGRLRTPRNSQTDVTPFRTGTPTSFASGPGPCGGRSRPPRTRGAAILFRYGDSLPHSEFTTRTPRSEPGSFHNDSRFRFRFNTVKGVRCAKRFHFWKPAKGARQAFKKQGETDPRKCNRTLFNQHTRVKMHTISSAMRLYLLKYQKIPYDFTIHKMFVRLI